MEQASRQTPSYRLRPPWISVLGGQSSEVDHGGAIHKRGNSHLRWAFVEAAIPATRSNLALKNLYDRIVAKNSKKAGPNKAKVAVARKLAVIAYRMLKEERPYENR